jgi:hypothetical protein
MPQRCIVCEESFGAHHRDRDKVIHLRCWNMLSPAKQKLLKLKMQHAALLNAAAALDAKA